MPPTTFNSLRRKGHDAIPIDVAYDAGKATLDFGGLTASMSCEHPQHEPPVVYDFALFLAAICSIQTRRPVTLDKPVTAGAVASVGELRKMFTAWRIPGVAPPRIAATNIVDDTSPGPDTALCLSGGVDSTYAALRYAVEARASRAILVHGADYLMEDETAFGELAERVGQTADRFALDLMIVRSDLQRLNFNWEMLHGIFFAAALHFATPRIGRALFALDYAGWQDHMTHPWGSSRALMRAVSGSRLRIDPVGDDVTRVDKIAEIAQHPELLQGLSVCFADRSTGKNCGRCKKCVRTRMALEFLGADTTGLFNARPDLLEYIRGERVPRMCKNVRGYYTMAENLHRIAPEGEIKDILARKLDLAWRRAGVPHPRSTVLTRFFRSGADVLRGLIAR